MDLIVDCFRIAIKQLAGRVQFATGQRIMVLARVSAGETHFGPL